MFSTDFDENFAAVIQLSNFLSRGCSSLSSMVSEIFEFPFQYAQYALRRIYKCDILSSLKCGSWTVGQELLAGYTVSDPIIYWIFGKPNFFCSENHGYRFQNLPHGFILISRLPSDALVHQMMHRCIKTFQPYTRQDISICTVI